MRPRSAVRLTAWSRRNKLRPDTGYRKWRKWSFRPWYTGSGLMSDSSHYVEMLVVCQYELMSVECQYESMFGGCGQYGQTGSGTGANTAQYREAGNGVSAFSGIRYPASTCFCLMASRPACLSPSCTLCWTWCRPQTELFFPTPWQHISHYSATRYTTPFTLISPSPSLFAPWDDRLSGHRLS